MLFSSMTFIYVFLPVVTVLYLLLRKELRNHLLLIASLVFYAWGEPRYLAIMLITILINYTFAILIEKSRLKETTEQGGGAWFSSHAKSFYLVIALVLDLGVLGYFKYFNFLIENLNALFHTHTDFIKVVMPIGISFYTFQAISYLMDIYRGGTAQKDIYKLALYISLFPQLVAGPIVKYHEIEQQIDDRTVTFQNISYGIKRFIIGLSKKMLIANTFGEVADKIFSQAPDSFSPGIAWLGAISYTLQIFFDFSGYSDMAIGLGAVFGFRFPENFNYPYISKTITEFWRRWHISLSSWFREYLYIPLGGNRKGAKRTYINLALVFLATGFWHGAAWNFIVWGAWNGFFVIIERFFGLNRKDIQRPKYQRFLLHFYCILAFIIGWVLFRAPDLHYALVYIGNMFALVRHEHGLYALIYYLDTIQYITLAFALIFCTPIAKGLLKKCESNQIVNWLTCIVCYGLLILSTAQIAASTYNPFIYFRF